jgi:tetratricopeptide (TPR) repeat protein
MSCSAPFRPTASTFVLSACVALLLAGGCQDRRAGLPRDALDAAWASAAPAEDNLPTLTAVLQLRAPVPAATPTKLLGSAAAVSFARGDGPVRSTVTGSDGDDFEAAALACLQASLVRDYAAVVPACVGFATRWPTDLRAAVAVQIVASHRGSLAEGARRSFLAALAPLVPACAAARTTNNAASCAELAVAVDDAARNVAMSLGDRAALRAARPGGDLVHATAEGPFRDADEALAGGPLADRPLVKHPRFRVFELEDEAGVLSPSRRSVDGWWRLTLRGEVPSERSGLLAVRASGGIEVRLDGTVVFVRHPDEPGATVEEVGVRVGAGVHVVEVLATETGRGLRISAFDDDGRPLLRPVPRQRWSRTATAAAAAVPQAVRQLTPSADVERGDTTALASLLFAHAMARAGLGADADVERVLARRLVDRFGWSAPALVAAAQTVEDDALPDRVAVALAAPLWSKVLSHWPSHPLALLSRARAASEERPDEALALYRGLVAAAPAYPIGRRELIDALLERGVIDEAKANAEALLALGETNENIATAAPALRSAGEVLRAQRLQTLRSRRTADDDDGRALLAEGDVDGARAELARRLERGDDRAFERWAALVELQDPAAVLRAVDELIRRFPDDTALQIRRAQLLTRLQGPAAGRQALDALETTDAQALRLRAAWGGETPTGDRAARGEAIIAARRGTTTPPFAGFPVVFLLDDLERQFAADGSSVVVRHWIAELRTKDALDAFGELRVDDDEVLVRLRVVKPDGTVVEPERHAGVDDVSLPGLAPGDLVEYLSWSVESSARHGFAWETRSLVQARPAVARSYAVEFPATLAMTRQLRILAESGAAAPTSTTIGPADRPRIRQVFTSDSAPPLLDEPGSVDRLESEAQGGFAIDLDDDVFRRRRSRPFLRASRPDPWLQDVAALVGGRGSETERTERLFRFVAQSIVDADSPSDAVSVLVVGRGQRQALFHALARAAGIETHALGVHATLDLDRRIPHGGTFSSIVSRVVTDGHPHVVAFLDGAPTWDGLSPWFTGAETIDLVDGTRGVLDDRHLEKAVPELVADLGIVEEQTGDRRLAGVVALRLPVYAAGFVRPALRKVTEARLGQVLEAALGGTLPGVKVTRVSTPGIDAEARPLGILASVEVPVTSTTVRLEHVFPGGAMAAFNLAPPLSSWSTVAVRRRALMVVPGAERLEVRLRVPERTAFIEVPPDVALTAGPLELRQKTSVFDDGLVWQRSIERRGARVSPAQWPALRAALGPLVAQADAHVALVLPGPAP